MEEYILEKIIWTEKDFNSMGWHDCPIHGITFSDNFTLDIDYVFKWILDEVTSFYSFWVSPATLVFENVSNLIFDVRMDCIQGLEIAGVEQKVFLDRPCSYVIDTQEGTIKFDSSGYKQYIKDKPILKSLPRLTREEKGGVNFNIEYSG